MWINLEDFVRLEWVCDEEGERYEVQWSGPLEGVFTDEDAIRKAEASCMSADFVPSEVRGVGLPWAEAGAWARFEQLNS